MSTDVSGSVFYGFALVDEEGRAIEVEGPWAKDEYGSLFSDWEDHWIETQGGLPEPDNSAGYRTPEWDEWRAARNAMIDASPAMVTLAGYEDNLIDCIAIQESFVRAYWSEIKPIPTLVTKPEWDKQLRQWCEVMGVPYRQPGWYVTALYF